MKVHKALNVTVYIFTDLILEGSSIGVEGLRPAPQRNEGGLSDGDLEVTISL